MKLPLYTTLYDNNFNHTVTTVIQNVLHRYDDNNVQNTINLHYYIYT